MEKEPKIFGKGLTSEERADAVEGIKVFAQEGAERMDGELEKTEEMRQFIKLAGGYLNEELRSLGLDEFDFDMRRIHTLPPEEFNKKFSDAEANGMYVEHADGIYVKTGPSRLQCYKSVFHEMVHQASFRSVYADNEERLTHSMRVGYANIHPVEDDHEHFRGLNEAVVDRIVRDVMGKHEDELRAAFHITEEEAQEPVEYYAEEMDVLDAVMNGIAKKNGEDPDAVWARFKRGEFGGEMMHLREVEKTFGKGALRVLAAMGSGTKGDELKAIENVLAFFNAESEASRDKIAKKVLIERERLRYDERKKPLKKKSRLISFFGSLLGK